MVGVQSAHHVFGLIRIPLQTSHDCFQVLHFNAATLITVEQIEYVTQVLDFVVSESRGCSRN